MKTTKRDIDTKKYLKTRLSTVEGQIRGVNKMVDEDRYCLEILTQLLAINKSIKGISMEILKSHLSSCVVKDIKDNNLAVIDEVMELIKRLG